MYLSSFSSLTEAAEWLTDKNRERWTWKHVIEMHLRTAPETISVVIPTDTPLLDMSGHIKEVQYSFPLQLEVCSVLQFLEHIFMGDSFETASAHPLGLVGFGRRFRSILPIRASAIRLHKSEIYHLSKAFCLDPFNSLIREVIEGKHPELSSLLRSPNAKLFDIENTSTAVQEEFTKRHLSKQRTQEEAILNWLSDNSYLPTALPARIKGGRGPKYDARIAMLKNKSLFTVKSFDLTWQRLRDEKKIIDETSLLPHNSFTHTTD